MFVDVVNTVLMMSQVREPPAPRLSGLLTKELPNGTTRWYNGVEREVELLGESRDILLPNVTCGDSGMYTCHLAAPVGEQNQEGQVLLTLTGKSRSSGHGGRGICPSEASVNLGTSRLSCIIF